VHAKSTDQLIIQWSLSPKFGLSEAIRWVQTKTDFTFWLIFGLSPNLGLSKSLSESLIQKVKWFNVSTKKNKANYFLAWQLYIYIYLALSWSNIAIFYTPLHLTAPLSPVGIFPYRLVCEN